jgi:hypothetical protein
MTLDPKRYKQDFPGIEADRASLSFLHSLCNHEWVVCSSWCLWRLLSSLIRKLLALTTGGNERVKARTRSLRASRLPGRGLRPLERRGRSKCRCRRATDSGLSRSTGRFGQSTHGGIAGGSGIARDETGVLRQSRLKPWVEEVGHINQMCGVQCLAMA